MKNILFQVGRSLMGVTFLLCGCAGMINGTTQMVSITSDPPEANASIEGLQLKTPAMANLSRKSAHLAKFEKEGYEPATAEINRQASWWNLIDVLWGLLFPIPLLTDLASGAFYAFDDEIHVTLVKSSTKIAEKSTVKADSGAALAAAASDVDSVTTTGRPRPHAHAVVIGIERYRQHLPTAEFAAHDAKIMSEYLTKAMGYAEENVVLLLNERAAKSDVEKYVEGWLPNRVEKDDSVFVYYSGHGAPNPKTGEAYLVPYDGDPTFVERTGYPLKRLYEHLANLPAKEVVLVLDSCFSGAGGRSVIAKGMRPAVVVVENPVLASGKTVVLAASGGDQVSSTYDQKGHGLLTYFFLKGLQGEADHNRDKAIELEEVYRYLKPQVERVARRDFNNEQTPQLIGSPELLKRGILLVERASP